MYNGFYRAKVVNNGFDPSGTLPSDSENRCRIQIRVLGLHSENNIESLEDGIPDANLPWAEQASSLMFGGFGPSNSGISVVPEIGSWVWVFFENGNPNKPIYFATMMGNNQASDEVGNNSTILKMKSGTVITIDDSDGSIDITTPDGESGVLIEDGEITLTGTRVNISIPPGPEGKLQLGNGEYYIVTAQSPNPVVTQGGVLYPRLNLRG